ncbi:MAG: hypothetical protein GEU26_07380 [Nitrososphaeraceae archaeon]|nr:hypothetical protein [Nitrososphaeraceae archaeon]
MSAVAITIDVTLLDLASGTTNMTGVSTNGTGSPLGNVTNTKYLEVIDHAFSEDLLFSIVNGTIVNNSNNTINSALVTVQFYDDNGTLITSSSETARSVILAPGENSTFNVRSDLGDEIAQSYQVIPGGDIQVG